MPRIVSKRGKAFTDITRKAARVIYSTIKKMGNTRGVTPQKIHNYIREAYPYAPSNIAKLKKTLERALSFKVPGKKLGARRHGLRSLVKSLNKPSKRRCKIVRSRGRGRKGKGRPLSLRRSYKAR